MGQEARRALLPGAWGGGVPTVTTAGNWPLSFPLTPWGLLRWKGVKMRVLSSSDYYDAENLP